MNTGAGDARHIWILIAAESSRIRAAFLQTALTFGHAHDPFGKPLHTFPGSCG
jgi:hypothetical protein